MTLHKSGWRVAKAGLWIVAIFLGTPVSVTEAQSGPSGSLTLSRRMAIVGPPYRLCDISVSYSDGSGGVAVMST